jgi:hypothetical protein
MSKRKAHLITIAILVGFLLILAGIAFAPEIVGWFFLICIAFVLYATIYGMLTDNGPSDDYRGW